MDQRELDTWHMRRALELAAGGRGHVEPNPLVGCVIARGAEIIGEGWHRRFGEAHAEVEALRIAGRRAAGATLYEALVWHYVAANESPDRDDEGSEIVMRHNDRADKKCAAFRITGRGAF